MRVTVRVRTSGTPAIRMCIASVTVDQVVFITRIEKRKVQIGSARYLGEGEGEGDHED